MMRKFLLPLLSAGLLMSFAGTAAAQSDVASTKHNLSTTANTTNGTFYLTTGTDEVCVFCHTPHAGASGGVVLWNRVLPTGSYTLYTSDTLDNLPGQPENVSLACLSCHDGTVGFDQLVNFPGSGAGSRGTTGWVFNGGDTNITGIALVGQDLTNDHPISMNLDPGNDGGLRLASLVTAAGVPLFTGTQGSTQVECASCHNPHEATLPTFYRIDNAASALCTTCHIK